MPDTVVDFVLHRIDTVTWLALSGPIKKERSIAEHRLGPEAGPDGQETLSRRTACHNLGCPSKLLEIISNTNHALMVQTVKRPCFIGLLDTSRGYKVCL